MEDLILVTALLAGTSLFLAWDQLIARVPKD